MTTVEQLLELAETLDDHRATIVQEAASTIMSLNARIKKLEDKNHDLGWAETMALNPYQN